MENIIELLFRIASILGWIFAGIVVIKNKIKLNKEKKQADALDEKLLSNKKQQETAEKELKNMAKFLCDNCGAETALKDAVSLATGDGGQVDLCPACGEAYKARRVALEEAEKAVQEAEKALAEAEERLKNVKAQNRVTYENVLNKLGL